MAALERAMGSDAGALTMMLGVAVAVTGLVLGLSLLLGRRVR